MIVTPLAFPAPRSMADVLREHGWDPHTAADAALGIDPVALHLTGVDPDVLPVLVAYAGRFGLDVVTGDDWAILAGTRSRLSAFARPWDVPEGLSEVAAEVGLALPVERVTGWSTHRGAIDLSRPVIMGVLNLTPDSFSDGGLLRTVDAALVHADRLLEDGATILDLGAESTRPGNRPVREAEELERLMPVLEAVVRSFPAVPLSVDTVKAGVARAALGAGAWIINDVSGFRLDPEMPAVVAGAGAGAVLMHSRGTVSDMASYEHAVYGGDAVSEVVAELRTALGAAVAAGVALERIVVDPGLGFAKTVEQSLAVLRNLEAFQVLGRPVLVGPSRKRFLGAITGREIADRDPATAAACVLAAERGAHLFRVHHPAAVRDALALVAAVGAR